MPHCYGHDIFYDGTCWRYKDDPTQATHLPHTKECKHCGKLCKWGTPDPCIGTLPNVTSACCGHGKDPLQIHFKSNIVVLIKDKKMLMGSSVIHNNVIEMYRAKNLKYKFD